MISDQLDGRLRMYVKSGKRRREDREERKSAVVNNGGLAKGEYLVLPKISDLVGG